MDHLYVTNNIKPKWFCTRNVMVQMKTIDSREAVKILTDNRFRAMGLEETEEKALRKALGDKEWHNFDEYMDHSIYRSGQCNIIIIHCCLGTTTYTMCTIDELVVKKEFVPPEMDLKDWLE